jgi:hypothetical protein
VLRTPVLFWLHRALGALATLYTWPNSTKPIWLRPNGPAPCFFWEEKLHLEATVICSEVLNQQGSLRGHQGRSGARTSGWAVLASCDSDTDTPTADQYYQFAVYLELNVLNSYSNEPLAPQPTSVFHDYLQKAQDRVSQGTHDY